MAHSHSRHKSVGHGHARAKQFLAENRGGTCAPKKKFGGSAGMRMGPSRGNDSAAADQSIATEGAKPKRRSAKVNVTVKGGPHLHVHAPIGPMGAAGAMAGPPPAPAGPPPGPAAGLPVGMPGRPAPFARGGHAGYYDPPEDVSSYVPAKARKAKGGGTGMTAGSATGVGRLEKSESYKREG
jgi:hypothetical protein